VPFFFQSRPDIVEADAGYARGRDGGHHHGQQPAARRADDGRPRDAQMIEKRQRILRFLRDGIGFGIGPPGSAAPAAVQPDQAHAVPDMACQIVEVATVPRQSGKAQHGQAAALVAIGKLRAVFRAEASPCHGPAAPLQPG
jgi:hypothetical protein